MTVEQEISMSGLLFQSHPTIGSWRSTRPGAYTGEVVAFKNDVANFSRLSLRFFREGERDENEYLYESDTYIVETIDNEQEYLWEPEGYGSKQEAVERIKEIMQDVTDSRE